MATYYVWSGATGANNGTSWTNAFTTLAPAVTAATLDGDTILVHKTHSETLAADTTYTFAGSVSVLCVDKDASDAPATMGVSYWIGGDATNKSINFFPAQYKPVYLRGLTLRTAGAVADSLTFHTTINGSQIRVEDCYLWQGNTAAASGIFCGGTTAGRYSLTEFINCTFRFGNAGQGIIPRAGADLIIRGGAVSGDGAVPDVLIKPLTSMGQRAEIYGLNATAMGTGRALLGDLSTANFYDVIARQCVFGAGFSPLVAQSVTTMTNAEVWLHDCKIGAKAGIFGYYNTFGALETDATVYRTAGAAVQSWKITTTAQCSAIAPFVSPLVDWYNPGTSSVTPRLEILRTDSASALTDAQVWGEFGVPTATVAGLPEFFKDRGAGSAQATGVGTGAWTGAGGTAWSGKVDTGEATTPVAGRVSARVVVAAPSQTLYIDPQIQVA